MTNKDKYRELCNTEPSIPIFMRDWWFDAVCEDSWDVIIYQQNNRIVAALPYYLHKKYGFKTIIPPHLSPIGGIWIKYEDEMNLSTKYTYEIKLMDYFAQSLDKLGVAWYYQHYHHKFTNWLGLYWKGFKQTTRYTYRVLGLEDLDKVYSSFHIKTKKAIRNSEQELKIIEDISLENFCAINSLTFARQGIVPPYSDTIIKRLVYASEQRNCLKRYAAIDKENNIHAVLMVVLEDEVCYSLVSGADPKYRHSGATTLLNYHVIRYANSLGIKEYDLTGSMIEPIEKFFRHFGAKQTPYFAIEKRYSKIYSLLRKIKK